MSKVVVKNGNVDGALRMFKQKNVKDGLLKEVRKREHYSKQKNVKDGLLKEVRKREHYSKPGERRREAKKEAIKNSRRRERNYN